MDTVKDVADKRVDITIVYDKARKEFANQLYTLISAEYEIAAVKMQEAPYVGREQDSTSRNYVLFLGDMPDRKIAIKQQNQKDESAVYGIYIGSYGRCAYIEVEPNYKEISKDRDKYAAYLSKTREYWENLKKQSKYQAKDLTWIVPVTVLLGVLVIPIALIKLPIANRKWIKRQLYACAIAEYYQKYLKSFLNI